MSDKVNIKCPNCGQKIDVDQILYNQLEDDIRQKYLKELSRVKQDFEDKESKLKQKERMITEKEALMQEQIDQKVKEEMVAQKSSLTIQLKKQLESENEDRIKSMQEELNSKSDQVKELNATKAKLEQVKREKEEQADLIKLEMERRLSQTLRDERVAIAKQESEKHEMKLRESNTIIEGLKSKLAEAQRKAEQGSMQLQGEVQEVGIEEWLAEQFPLDTISEVKKGQRGADCIQVVHTRQHQNCGTIYYESKRTKEFYPSWIEKFRDDMREQGANIGVMVTDAMPKGMERMGLVEGIWVCTFQEFKGLCFVLRENIIQMSNALTSQENKGEKMNMLYDFLTSNEFKLQIEAIVEGFTQMHIDLLAEKKSITGHWKKREKQIQKVLLNTNHMYHSIKGIAGNAIQSIQSLELPQPTEEDLED